MTDRETQVKPKDRVGRTANDPSIDINSDELQRLQVSAGKPDGEVETTPTAVSATPAARKTPR